MSNTENLLELRNICFSVDQQIIIDNLSLTLQPNEFKVITGPSGCGKSTLLKIIASLFPPSSGDIFLHGKNIITIKPEEYRQKVSYCFQTPVLFGEIVSDNLRFPYQIRGDKVDNEKIKKGLLQFDLPLHILDKKIDELSGGEKQRVALLRNLQYQPEILLLDEITSALDDKNKEIVHQVIDDLIKSSGIAVLWVTHNSDEIRQSHNLLRMEKHEAKGEEQ
ncbi:ATP-binding component of an ABC superfamily transporter [Hafnia paralvei ATCC 29927]|uniref:iron efflux ABC transporter ATP-binding subunit FetA n=1 Tax=Hafnia paralvei TaxID=546367 RepID=UPI0007E436BD|nr:iron ABC transporter ATP-binding protein FetA [Hafnia paralvei]MDU1191205.1 iron ABC transporter ATP-binding protein FetA [Enterobacteriaceae bacterium]MCE9904861.1 iron ABC transporter ATP-binding protein FetA [Hafnia paralvei]MCE9919147.1 iron ABC transporter ATP-binding protein FetA [Hafnia paralvei]MDU1244167.1 iron ABC transporter ATP-binding protein FetA [Enterobacteriaceae bacterium]OAT42085.1 ATP-binding component of an ABC superfamily transporter [Hafnia paralvei ATCC 29927]